MMQSIKNSGSYSFLIPVLSGKGVGVSGDHRKSAHGGWLLSLADLVTLLMSVIIVTAELSNSPESKTSSLMPRSEPLTIGTSFAKSSIAEISEQVVFKSGDFENASSELSISGLKTLKLLDNFKDKKPQQVNLKSCLGNGTNTNWHESLSQLLTLSSHAFDGVKGAERRIVVMADDCSVRNKPSAVVEFIWKKENGG